MRIKAIIFDFDGVKVVTQQYHFERCLSIAQEPFSYEEFLRHHDGNFYASQGSNTRNIFEGIDWSSYPQLMKNSYPILPICEEKKETVKYLHSKFYHLSIVSSGEDNLIRQNLSFNRLLPFYDEIYGKHVHRSKVHKLKKLLKKYNLYPDECIFITDTLGDIFEAREVGIESIAVTYGYHRRTTLEKGNPLHIIDSLGELQRIY